mmetsp:Transcript_57972/g.135554  ORF Transcript_57972/g.135554 Transcript_57972/m.135554 type:complete len:437 (+) Transcript_57972:83-1393(+)
MQPKGSSCFLTCLLSSALAGALVLSITAEYLYEAHHKVRGRLTLWVEHTDPLIAETKVEHKFHVANNVSPGVHFAPYKAPNGTLCDAQQRLLPELYLIGAQKAGSTQFAEDLHKAGFSSCGDFCKEAHFHPWGSWAKEWHFFKFHKKLAFDPLLSLHAKWHKTFPSCAHGNAPRELAHSRLAQSKLRRPVLSVFSPFLGTVSPNHSLVTREVGLDLTGSIDRGCRKGGSCRVGIPLILSRFYGSLRNRVTLIVLLRETLSRMQSAWYYCWAKGEKRCHWGGVDSRVSFKEDVVSAMKLLRVRRTQGLLQHSLYGYLLHAWMSAFHPSQFIVIPNRYYTSLATERVCQAIGYWFGGIEVSCPGVLSGMRKNPSKHPPLADDIPAKLQIKFRALIEPDMSLLRHVLLHAHANGALLVMFEPKGPATEENVDSWLKTGW